MSDDPRIEKRRRRRRKLDARDGRWSADDVKDWESIKGTLEVHAASVVEVAAALTTAKDRELWRLEYDSFDAFVRDYFQFSVRRAQQIRQAGRILESVAPDAKHVSPERLSDRGLRELDRLPEKAQRIQALEAAQSAVGEGHRPTARHVAEAVQTILNGQDDGEVTHVPPIAKARKKAPPPDSVETAPRDDPRYSLWQRQAAIVEEAKRIGAPSEVTDALTRANRITYEWATQPALFSQKSPA